MPRGQYVFSQLMDHMLKAMLIEANRRASDLDAGIENLKLQIAKLRHARFGNSSERASVLMDQLELQLGELVERRAQETAAQEIAALKAQASGKAPPRRRSNPVRRPLPDHLPRERVVLPSPQACPCCGGPAQAGRGRDRDAGAGAGALESGSVCAGENDLPQL